ncbi:hypothetical protein HD806DRAFT_549431 [Xylariaceae sp. AK1471]|nr:hypothetical protein HD806DRAFT_549431 [Xylariaceae sp. AK1471]
MAHCILVSAVIVIVNAASGMEPIVRCLTLIFESQECGINHGTMSLTGGIRHALPFLRSSCTRRVARSLSLIVDSQYNEFSSYEFPYSATKLVTEQHLWVHPTGPSWACLVIGSFYDAEDRELWRIELLLGYRGGEDSRSEFGAGSESHSLVAATSTRGTYSTTDRDLCLTEDGYPLLTTGTQIDIDSYPLLHKVDPKPLPRNFDTTLGVNPQLEFNYPPSHTTAFMAGSLPGRGGWSARFGWDSEGGPLPDSQAYGTAAPAGMPYGGVGAGGFAPPVNQVAYGQPQAPVYQYPPYGYYGANDYNRDQRPPQPHPRVSSDVPGMNMVNSMGGAGCEPGYNYIFHHEHTKIHVFRSSTPPWRAPAHMNFSFAKFHVPTNTTLAELMVRFGATNPCAKKNKVAEVIEGGNGKWYRGNIFSGDEKDAVQQTLKEIGWDRSRTGRGKPVVWLWITKD